MPATLNWTWANLLASCSGCLRPPLLSPSMIHQLILILFTETIAKCVDSEHLAVQHLLVLVTSSREGGFVCTLAKLVLSLTSMDSANIIELCYTQNSFTLLLWMERGCGFNNQGCSDPIGGLGSTLQSP